MKRFRRALIPYYYKCLKKNVKKQVSPANSTSSRATWCVEDFVDFGPNTGETELNSLVSDSLAGSTTTHVTWWLQNSGNPSPSHGETHLDGPAQPSLASSTTNGVTDRPSNSAQCTRDSAEVDVKASVSVLPANSATSCSTSELTGSASSGGGDGDGGTCMVSHQELQSPARTSDFCGGPENCGELYAILEPTLREIRELRQECERLGVVIKTLNKTIEHEKVFMRHSRVDRPDRCVNNEHDKNAIKGPMQAIRDSEEKLQGRSEEHCPDTNDDLETSREEMSMMDLQQQQEQSSSNEQLFTYKLNMAMIKFSFTMLLIISLMCCRVANMALPFLHTDLHVLMTTTLLIVLAILVV